MRKYRFAVVGVCLLVLLASSARTAPATPQAREAVPVIAGPQAHITLSAGNPGKLALLGSWVAVDPNTPTSTDSSFLTTDNLAIVVNMITSSTRDAVWSVEIMDGPDSTIFEDEFVQAAPTPGQIYFWNPAVGSLPEGFYLVTVKVKQGTQRVGSKYWLFVIAP